jgi:hypothetical protein
MRRTRPRQSEDNEKNSNSDFHQWSKRGGETRITDLKGNGTQEAQRGLQPQPKFPAANRRLFPALVEAVAKREAICGPEMTEAY